MTGLCCRECKDRSESREDDGSESTSSAIEKDGARVGSDFAGDQDKVEMEQDLCKHVCRGELELTPCS